MPSDTSPNPAVSPAAAAPDPPGKQHTDSLPPRQEAFCHYFVLWGNASVAASEAGYARKSAKNQGYRLGRRPRIRARIHPPQRQPGLRSRSGCFGGMGRRCCGGRVGGQE